MIGALKKWNKYLLYALLGVAMGFATLRDLFMISGMAAYTVGSSYATLLTVVAIFSVIIFALIGKLVIYLSFRINGAIFSRKSGLLYPFPIGYRDYESTSLVFLIFAFLLAGAVSLPSLFLPTLQNVLGVVRTLVIWTFLALTVRFFLKHNSHYYDRKTLAFSLSILPLIFLGINLLLGIVEVVR